VPVQTEGEDSRLDLNRLDFRRELGVCFPNGRSVLKQRADLAEPHKQLDIRWEAFLGQELAKGTGALLRLVDHAAEVGVPTEVFRQPDT